MKKYWLSFASVLMIIVGLLRGMGGVTLLTQGDKVNLGLPVTASPTELKIAAYGLIAVCLLLVISAVSLTIRRLVSNYAFCWASLLLFLASGLINGFLLFGHPLGSGQLINWGVSFVIGLCLVLGKDSVHSKYIQEYENNNDHTTMINELLQQTLAASRQLVMLDDVTINRILTDTASALLSHQTKVLTANAEDLQRMDPANPKYDRLKLTEERLAGIAGDMKNVASLPSPLGKLLSETTRPNGMVIRKITVPFGVIGVIYEARPNVTFDVFSLCLKSGNACVLKGGSDADSTNRALVAIIHNVLAKQGVNPAVCTLLPPDREATTELLNAVGLVDLIIPRGSSSLINFVRDHARVPVIETGAGICHIYFDKDGDKEKGREIVNNAKTRRVSVCNALDCLIVHHDRLDDLTYLCGKLSDSNVVIYADEPAFAVLSGHYPAALLQPATVDSFGTEFLDYKMAIRTVSSLDEALQHIARYSSKHSESIVSESTETIRHFQQMVDAACVYANVSTAFTDGAQFGFGAEIGISTQKLHARGPMALPELTTYKYIIEGDGQIRK